jgi:hypothetical protein
MSGAGQTSMGCRHRGHGVVRPLQATAHGAQAVAHARTHPKRSHPGTRSGQAEPDPWPAPADAGKALEAGG